jgi:TolA-binding protein
VESLLLQHLPTILALAASVAVTRKSVERLERENDARIACISELEEENRKLEGRVIALETARTMSDRETNRRLETIEKLVERMDQKIDLLAKHE